MDRIQFHQHTKVMEDKEQDGNDAMNMAVVYKKRFGYVPQLLVNAAYVIDGKAKSPGLFQTAGEKSPEMTRLLTHCRDNRELRKADIHSVVETFKEYLVNLSEPLLTSDLYQIMMTSPPEAVSGQLIFALRDHRAANLSGFVILHFVICLFKELTSYRKHNGLDVHTIARIFATDVIKPMEEKRSAAKQDSSEQVVSAQQLSLMTSLVMHLIKNEHIFKLAKILGDNSVAPTYKASAFSDTLLTDEARGVRTSQEVARTLADIHARWRRPLETGNTLEAGPSSSQWKNSDAQDSQALADQHVDGIRFINSTTADCREQGLESKRRDFLECVTKPGSEDSRGTGCTQKNTVRVGALNYNSCTWVDQGEARKERKAGKNSKKKAIKDKARKSCQNLLEASKSRSEVEVSRDQVQEFNPYFIELDLVSPRTNGSSHLPRACSSSAEGQEGAGRALTDACCSRLLENCQTSRPNLEQRKEIRFSVCENKKKSTKKSKSLPRQDGKVIRKTETSGEAVSDVESSVNMKITAQKEVGSTEVQLTYTCKKKAGSSITVHDWEQVAPSLISVVPSLVEHTLLSMQRAQQDHAPVKSSSDTSQGKDTLVLRRGQANKKKNVKNTCKQVNDESGSDNEAAQDVDSYSDADVSSLAEDDQSESVFGNVEQLSANENDRKADRYEPAADSKQSLALRKRKARIGDDEQKDEDIDPTPYAKSLKTYGSGKNSSSRLKGSASEPSLSSEDKTWPVGARTRRLTDPSTPDDVDAHSDRESLSVLVKKKKGKRGKRHRIIVVEVTRTCTREPKNDAPKCEDRNWGQLESVFGDSVLARISFIALLMFVSNMVMSLLQTIFSHFYHR